MKQIVIRILTPQVPVFDVQTGQIDEKVGHFVPDSDVEGVLARLGEHVAELVRFDKIFGGKAFVTSDNLGFLIRSLIVNPAFTGLEFYPEFFVIKINDNGTKEEEKSR
ncbi:hypothetical protein [Dipodfec virus UA23Rod_963]|uniref:Uncharacterized protein n=1 Tax=Dipodfec virus UA23Rod_963 TaxID=2929335 RepID=A0A976N2J0_9VIRU|nr:hypothetical protein [Dipodfec virus UA23Rod_963]